jgi:hypothetical protein
MAAGAAAAAGGARGTAQAPGAGPQLTLELFFALSIALIYGTFENIHGTAARVAACAARPPARTRRAHPPPSRPRGARPEDAVDCEFAEPT